MYTYFQEITFDMRSTFKIGLIKAFKCVFWLQDCSGADFTNTFRLLSHVPWPEVGDDERVAVGHVVDRILEQCASIEELKVIVSRLWRSGEGVYGGQMH